MWGGLITRPCAPSNELFRYLCSDPPMKHISETILRMFEAKLRVARLKLRDAEEHGVSFVEIQRIKREISECEKIVNDLKSRMDNPDSDDEAI